MVYYELYSSHGYIEPHQHITSIESQLHFIVLIYIISMYLSKTNKNGIV